MNNNIKQEVEELLHELYDVQDLEWHSPSFFTSPDGCDGHIFPDEDSAAASVLSGDDHQNAVDFVDGAMTDDEWIDYLKDADVQNAEDIIWNHDWDELVKSIVNIQGPAFFLSDYSGTIHTLSDGSILYF